MNTASLFDLIVIGAGPAGLSAALTAAEHGLRVVVVDEQHDVGGQIFRQAPATFSPTSGASSVFKHYPYNSYPFGQTLLQGARQAKQITWRLGMTAWGVFRKHTQDQKTVVQVAISNADTTHLLQGKTLLIATGAYDLPVAFAGWTLPGVMSAGGVQTLIKSQHILPGQRFVLAGSHPLLLLVADLLVQVGAQVLEVAVARPKPGMLEWLRECLRSHRALFGHVALLWHTAKILRNLQRHKVPIRFGSVVQQVQGKDDVQQVTLCNVDHAWKRQPGTQRVHQADTLVIGYGLLASSELARQAGCAVQWQPAQGGWVVRHDAYMRSSVQAIYVAGEPAGVAGAEVAYLQGRLAALHIAATLNPSAATSASATRHRVHDPHAKRLQHTQRDLSKAQRFADAVLRFFEPRLDALAQLSCADPETHICRCEEVSVGTVQTFLREHPHVSDVNSVKLACRTGMGWCQGRYCQHTVAQLLAQTRQRSVEQSGIFTAQAPVKPVTIAALAHCICD